jgi:hypothetical protein
VIVDGRGVAFIDCAGYRAVAGTEEDRRAVLAASLP